MEISVNVCSSPFLRESLGVDSKADFTHSKDNPSLYSAKITIGISQRDDTVFLPLKSLNKLICAKQKCGNNDTGKNSVSHKHSSAKYDSVRELIYAPICYEEELYLRTLLCGYESINPIIIIDDEVAKDLAESQNLSNNTKSISNPLAVNIESFFQDERVFEVIEIV